MADSVYCAGLTIAAAGLWGPAVSSVTLPGGGADIVVNTTAAHGLFTGQSVTLSGTTGVTGLNATWVADVTDSDTFKLRGSGALTGTPAGSPVLAIPDLDISADAYDGPWTLKVRVYGEGVVAIEDTVDNWSATQQRFLVSARSAGEGQDFSFPWYAWDGNDRFGTASAKLRVRLVSGTNVKVTVIVEK